MKIFITGGSGFIGINLIDHLLHNNIDFINVDINPPAKKEHIKYWKKCDILSKEKLQQIFSDYQPTHVIHLAARTDTDSVVLEDYKSNTEGTANILEAIKQTSSIERIIITSTQFVCKPDSIPKNDEDYYPHTIYGESKVISEKLTRNANLTCCWTLIRPTNVWGPWHPRYPKEFWNILRKGMYFHPGKKPVIRSYAYVGNVIFQIMKIFELPAPEVNKRVFYVGDMPINLYYWVNAFSRKLIGRNVRVVPRFFIRLLGYTGDILSVIGIKFPITSSRYRSMVQDYPTPMEITFKTLGTPPYSMEQGVETTVQWLNNEYIKLV